MRFYERLINLPNRMDSPELQEIVRGTVVKLNEATTTPEMPGVLLGKIQSGKTRGFIGIIAESFSTGYDIAIVLTKNSQLLGLQTTNRLETEFSEFISTGEFADVHYVNTFHATGDTLTPVQLMQKQIFVGIKNYLNIDKLIEIFDIRVPLLKDKRILIIDDEADYGSVGFRKVKGQTDPEMIKTAAGLSQFRSILRNYSFLQVTATPYSLYLQPENYVESGFDYKPLKPAFTQILPTHSGYVGGEFYFEDESNDQSPAYHLHNTCRPLEIETLSDENSNPQILDYVSTTAKLEIFRKSILYFIAGVSLRRAQFIQKQNLDEERTPIFILPKYAFVFHIQTSKEPMIWQKSLLDKYLEYLIALQIDTPTSITTLFDSIINDLLISVEKGSKLWGGINIPTEEQILFQLRQLLTFKDYKSFLINSDERVIDRTDNKGQLKLEAGLTFFIGGQVLDRGITIDNLIGFFYGRSPEVSKMDTILQHARMYGNRAKEDLCVTRFYTAQAIYSRMKEIHFLDVALREQLVKSDKGIVSIRRAANGSIIPCDPSRIALSNIITIKKFKRLLPYGFNVKVNGQLNPIIQSINTILQSYPDYTSDNKVTFEISFQSFVEIIDLIDNSFIGFDTPDLKWDTKLVKDLVKRFLDEASKTSLPIYVRTNLEMGRFKASGDFITVPETSSTDGAVAKIAAANIPCLVLLGQKGRDANQAWNGGPFYWPVIYCPGNLNNPIIFSW